MDEEPLLAIKVIHDKFSINFLSWPYLDTLRPGDPGLGEPAGIFQFLRAVPPALPAERVADPSRSQALA